MESYTISYLPHLYSVIHIALFENVTNAPEIRKRLIAASTMEGDEGEKARAEVDYGFVEADLLVSRDHLLIATLTALLSAFPSSTPTPSIENLSISNPNPSPRPCPLPKTRSHNLHSELLLYLSPNNNISDSIRRHGMSNQTTRLAIVHITSPDVKVEDVWKGIDQVVEGELVSWDKLQSGTDWSKVDKIYKLSELNTLKNDPNILEKKINAVISTVAIKNVT